MTRCVPASRWAAVLGWALLAMFQVTGPRPACGNTDQLAAGSSSHHLRRKAVEGIPLPRMTDQTQLRIREVVEKPSFYRRLPVTSLDTDPEYFQFLVRQPEVIVNIWEVMGVSRMTTQRLGPYQIRTDDGAGTTSELELVYGDDAVHVYYGQGAYDGPLLRRPVTGRCVFVVHSRAQERAPGGFDLTCQVDVFLKVDNATASLITKSLQPLVGTTADHNFQESLRFVERLTKTTRSNGPGVKALGRQLKLDAQVQQGFEEVVDLVFQRSFLERGIDPVAGVELYEQANGQAAVGAEAADPYSAAPNTMPAPTPNGMTTQVAKPPLSQAQPEDATPPAAWLPAGTIRARLSDVPQGSAVEPAGYRLPARGQQAPSYPSGNVYRGQ